jgi:protein ImuA
MALTQRAEILAELRVRMQRLERGVRVRRAVLPFGVPALDRHLGGGLALGVLHEVAGEGADSVHGAAAALFIGGVLARLPGPVLWCLGSRDLFAPGLRGIGLDPDRVIYVEAGDAATMLQVMEEGLRHGGLAGVVGELSRLPMVATRRLQLAAEARGTTAFALCRWRAATQAEPSAAVSRWRVAALPSVALPVPGIGRARWRLELRRCRGAEAGHWIVEACDAQGRLALPAELADGSAATADGRLRAAS